MKRSTMAFWREQGSLQGVRMDTTRASLLLRIKDPRNTQAWSEFYDLYALLIYQYARARGLSHADADDVRSNCYVSIVRQMPHFEYEAQKGGFKAWLRTMVNRRVIDLLRKRKEVAADTRELAELEAEDGTGDEIWEQQWKRQHLRYCVQQARQHVAADTYEAFRLLVQQGYSVSDVCEKLSMNANQVYKAKSRVLKVVQGLAREMGAE